MEIKTFRAQAGLALVALTSCATYEARPIDPTEVLTRLEALQWDPARVATDEEALGSVGVGPAQLAAFAVRTNPRLAAVRAQIGVRDALLVEAGLLPDPELGWDAMDVLASQVVNGTSTTLEVLSGFGLMFPLPRPGERDARVGAAEWRVAEAKQLVTAAEWRLTRDVHLAYEDVQAAEVLLDQSHELSELATSTKDYFQRAREAGAATAIEANLALGELQGIQLDSLRAESRLRQARQDLNGLLGLPAHTEIELRPGQDPSSHQALTESASDLTAHAVLSRPDLAALLARYRAAEEELQLAVSMQYPLFAIGTGISLTLPLFTEFGRPAMRTALARREELDREFTAAVHEASQEIAAAHATWRFTEREVELIETELLPNAEQTLELSRQAFLAGEVTLLETLALQQALVTARRRHAEARAQRARQAWTLLAASGWLLGPETATPSMQAEVEP